MRIPGRRYRDEWIPNYYPARQVGEGQWLRVSRTGKTVVLSSDEDLQLTEVFMEEGLFERLERSGHILTPGNAARIFDELHVWHNKCYSGPDLHIVVLTKRCNLDCSYCHMNPEPVGSDSRRFDLQPDTAREIIRFISESPSSNITIEFQGGEPFLNFGTLRFFVEEARRLDALAGKHVRFTVVSNLMVAKDEQLAFCMDNGISISYTLNGPQHIHDHYRKTRSGSNSYLIVIDSIRQIQAKYPGLIATSPLCVIDADNSQTMEQMIDFFYEAGFSGLSLIRLKNLGNARKNNLALEIREFLKYYIAGLDYIFDKNRGLGRVFFERSVPVALRKIICDSNVGLVDWRNPCGDVSGAITYDYDGEILPADEARSLRAEFGLGNVKNTTYEGLIRKRETFRTMNLSLRDRDAECRECAFNPYCGVMPVIEFARTGNPIPVPHQSEECLFTLAIFDWVFKKLMTEPLPLYRMLGNVDDELVSILKSSANHA